MWQGFLQDKISAAVGATVAFEKLSVSPFRGVVDGQGLRATIDEGVTPFLTVDRVRLKVDLTKLLSKRLQVETVLLERPVVSIERGPDGKTNLPLDRLSPPADAKTEGDDGGSSWAAGLQQLLIGQAVVRYVDRSPGFDGYALEAGAINLQLDQAPGGMAKLTGVVESIRRTDKPAQLGGVRISGDLTGMNRLSDLRAIGGRMKLELDSLLSIDLERAGETLLATIASKLVLGSLMPLLPPWIESLIPSWLVGAQSDLKLNASWSPQSGLKVTSAAV